MANNDITPERVRELFRYDEDTGLLYWRVTRCPTAIKGVVAGTVLKYGYTSISLDRTRYAASRLIWVYAYGVWPEYNIDHIDGNPRNNRLENLRDVPQAINSQNRQSAQKNNKSTGVLGVQPLPSGKFRAKMTVAQKTIHIGCCDTIELAHAAYLKAKRRLHKGCTI